jgi:hypothetical protein
LIIEISKSQNLIENITFKEETYTKHSKNKHIYSDEIPKIIEETNLEQNLKGQKDDNVNSLLKTETISKIKK